MKAWQIRLDQMLTDTDAPPVLTRDLLDRFSRSAQKGRTVPKSTLSYWIHQAVDAGNLISVQRGLYLNQFRTVPGRLADAVPLLYRDAVVSLNTVLGDAGVLNNPSNTVTVVVPIDPDAPLPHLGRKSTSAGDLHFFGLPRHFLQAGRPNDRLAPEHQFEHARATPEKALVDWLYLAQSPRSRRSLPPRSDIDIALLRLPRLRRLAAVVALEDELKSWVESSAD